MPTLFSVLEHTAKDWWKAERASISSLADFEDTFLRKFLGEDHEQEAERRIRDSVDRM